MGFEVLPSWDAPVRAQGLRVVILGGGFAGFHTARALEAIAPPHWELTLISRTPYQTLTPLLFEACSGEIAAAHAANAIESSLRRTLFVQGEVRAIDPTRRCLAYAAGPEAIARELPYDQLVLALGGVARRDLFTGAEGARAFKTLDDALALRQALMATLDQAVERATDATPAVAILGGGLVGVELAGELSVALPRWAAERELSPRQTPRLFVIEAGSRLLPELSASLGREAERILVSRGVNLWLGMPVTSLDGQVVTLADGRQLDAAVSVLATGLGPNPLLAGLPFPHGPGGRLLVSPTLQVPGYPEVWALGDCAAVPSPDGRYYPPLAQHAVHQAPVLARNLVASLSGESIERYCFDSPGLMASLGPGEAVIAFQGWHVWGSAAWLARQAYYWLELPTASTRLGMLADGARALAADPFGYLFDPGGVRPPMQGLLGDLVRLGRPRG